MTFVAWMLMIVLSTVGRGYAYNLSPFIVATKLDVFLQPGDGVAGEELSVQPRVALIDDFGDLVDTSQNDAYDGKFILARFMADKLPLENRFAVVYQTGTDGIPFAPIVKGWANFTGIKLNDLGEAFELNFFSLDFGLQIDSAKFKNVLGDPFELQILMEVGTATGGEAFLPQPVVGIVDRGGNTIQAIEEGTLTVAICLPEDGFGCDEHPGGQLLTTSLSSAYTVDIVEGKGVFSGIAIDKMGYPYQLIFTTTFSGIAVKKIVTNRFTVGAGRAVRVLVESAIAGARGGIPFSTQPKISVRDAGGNIVTENALVAPFSELQVYLVNNPTGALLYSEDAPLLSIPIVNGTANATDLAINKIGQGYQVRYTAIMRKVSGEEYSVFYDSTPFDVSLGDPDALTVQRPIGGAFSGGLPFYEQPIIQLVDRGGNVYDQESSKVVTAELLVSPTGFDLTGLKTSTFFRGIARFRSLKLVQVGENYVIRFSTTINDKTLSVDLSFDVQPSTEYEVLADDADHEDRFGHSLSIFDDTILIGSPKDDLTVKEVQRITATSDKGVVMQNEVQRIQTKGAHQVEIQEIVSCGYGGPEKSILGYFSIEFDGIISRPIRYDIHPSVLKSYLEIDIPTMGSLTVEKVRNDDCDSQHNYKWTIYFDTLQGDIPEVIVNSKGLVSIDSLDPDTFYHAATEYPGVQSTSTATTVTITVSTLQESPVLGGKFRLLVGGDGTTLGDDLESKPTVEVRFDVSPLDLKLAIENVVRTFEANRHQTVYDTFNIVEITREGPDNQNGYIWDITFPVSSEGISNWRQLGTDGSSLTGVGPIMKATTLVEGTAPLDGQFSLWFKGAGPTALIDFNESPEGMTTKLEGLPTIDSVEVVRSSYSWGTTWTVTFHETRTHGIYGYDKDVPQNLPPVRADTYMLLGTNSHVFIEYVYAIDDMDTLRCASTDTSATYDMNKEPDDKACVILSEDEFLLPEDMPVMGKYGHETGSAYIVYNKRESFQWLQTAKLQASDAKPFDHFGWSVSLDNSVTALGTRYAVAVVGAPHASYAGDPEIQAITCTGDSGTLAFRFRSHISTFVNFDVTAPQLKASLESCASIVDVTVKYYVGGTEKINLQEDNSGHGLCQPQNANPATRVTAMVTFVYPNNGDLPLIEGLSMNQEIATIPLLFDSSAPVGRNGHRYGKITVSEIVKGTIFGKQTGEDGYNTGAAYVFLPISLGEGMEEVPTNGWEEDAKLMSSDGFAGDEFGYAVTVYLDTIVIGAPNHDYDAEGANRVDGAGALYVFTRDGQTGKEVGLWVQTQKLVVPDRAQGDALGSVVVIKGNTIVSSTPGKDGETGRVYIWKRQALTLPFKFDQAISAEGISKGDRFGSSLAIDGDTLIIGAENTHGPSADESTYVNIFTAGAQNAEKRARFASDGAGMKRVGAAYSYTRTTFQNTFKFHQRLTPRTPRPYGRFGHSVSIENDLLLITEQEEYRGGLTSRRYIYSIRTYVDDGLTGPIGNLFSLTWRSVSTGQVKKEDVRVAKFSAEPHTPGAAKQQIETEIFEERKTSWLQFDVSAEEMQSRIDQELFAGDILVSRTDPDSNGGFTWIVTFVELSSVGGKAGTLPLLGAQSRLTGNGKIEVTLLQEPLPYIHGETHLFKRRPTKTGDWTEHAVMRPEVQQDGDLFGSTVSLRGRYSAVGAPNRDQIDTSGINGGAVYVFDMGFTNVQFSSTDYGVLENAEAIDIGISRCEPACMVGTAPTPGPPPADFGLDEVDKIQFRVADGTATGRSDCLSISKGTSECLWLNADDHAWEKDKIVVSEYIEIPESIPYFVPPQKWLPFFSSETSSTYSQKMTGDSYFSKYDFRAISDYAPIGGQLVFEAGAQQKEFQVVITDDDVNEKPDETVNLLLFSAGFRPIPGGDYWSTLTIEDDGDGGVGTHDSYEQVYASRPSEHARYGSATSIDGDITVMGAPFEVDQSDTEDLKENAGAVYIYRRTSAGVWTLEQVLVSPNSQASGRFGLSLMTRDLPPHRVIIGAPGESPPAVYIYIRISDDPKVIAPKDGTGKWELEATFSLNSQDVFDPRCDPDNSGSTKRCQNDHHPITSDSFYAGENAVALHGRFAVVGAKGLESAFVYRLKRSYKWYFFQLLKSSDYDDSVYPPPGSEHAKIYVKRPLFGSSVASYDDTIVVGAELEEYDRYADKDKKTDQDVGLTCEQAGFGPLGETKLYKGQVNAYANAYTWIEATDEMKTELGAFQYNENKSFVSQVTCEELDAFTLTIRSNGIPDHPMGIFPLPVDTMGSGEPDNMNGVKEHSFVTYLPRFPNITTVNPQSILRDKNALPKGPIGFALNGVPFVNPLDAEGDDTTDVYSYGHIGMVADLCNGGPVNVWDRDPEKRLPHMYAYRSNPYCLYQQPDAIAESVPKIVTGKIFAFKYEKKDAINPDPGNRSPKIGYALDGFPIYGPFDENGNIPEDLDECNGRHDTDLGHYVYHITPWQAPYTIGCIRGKITTTIPQTSNNYPEFNPGGNDPRDMTFYGRGAAYVFVLKPLNGNPFSPGSIKGIDVSPKQDPFDEVAATDAFHEHVKLTPGDPERGDRFGHAVALHRDQLLVSAFMDSAKPRSTWDFETGDLRGWAKTGTAFSNQPTFGDNTLHRNVYGDILVGNFRDHAGEIYHGSGNREGTYVDIYTLVEGELRTVAYGPKSTHVDHPTPVSRKPNQFRDAMYAYFPHRGESCNHRGRFWIGTFEDRPATFQDGGFVPSEPEGNVQGDEPQGTLTSDPFPIYGTKLSFRIGGGCDIALVYVELLIDGISVRRVSGECSEKMREVKWDLSGYKYQSGTLRIVDLSSSRWGHINVDDIRFNWDPSFQYRSKTPSGDGSDRRSPSGGAMMYTGEPQAGAVYAFRRYTGAGTDEPCEITCDEFTGCSFINDPPQRWTCLWQEQEKLQPSDRRAYEKFGWAIDVDDDSGIAVVGAVHARVVDQYNHDDFGGFAENGAIYLFRREPEDRTEGGTFVAAPKWSTTEHVKLQAPDKVATGRDHFGFSVAVSGYTVVAGAPGKNSMVPVGEGSKGFNAGMIRSYPEGGAGFMFDGAIINVRFEQQVFVVKENHQTLPNLPNRVKIWIRRFGDLTNTVSVAYQTSDLTANGISEAKSEFCLGLDYTQRGENRCGDYVQQRGVLKFDPEDELKVIEILTINDNCNERYSEYVRLQLSLPGGPPLLGEPYTAVLRIDDDDSSERVNMLFCPQVSMPLSESHPQYAHIEQPDTKGTPARKHAIPLTEHLQWIQDNL
mmetsp:Transcript_5343/g.9475  ORF Transcript_5343/g.9475 Transcript_5343/m.9475 type:complete len:3258 (-) Transcript_5343:1649-11422(-)